MKNISLQKKLFALVIFFIIIFLGLQYAFVSYHMSVRGTVLSNNGNQLILQGVEHSINYKTYVVNNSKNMNVQDTDGNQLQFSDLIEGTNIEVWYKTRLFVLNHNNLQKRAQEKAVLQEKQAIDKVETIKILPN